VKRRRWEMDRFPEKILLSTDGSEDAALAGRAAADLAKSTGARLHVVHAWNPEIRRAYEMTLPEPLKEWCEQQATQLLAKEVEHIEEAGGKVTEEHLARGRPVDVILDLCEQLGSVLVVMGSRGLGPVRRILIGSVSEGVVHHAHSPILVMRGGAWAWPPHRVVVGMDFSEDARAAGELASIIGKHYGTRGVLVRTYPEIVHWTELEQDRRELYDHLIEDLLASEKRALEARAAELAELLCRRPEVEVKVGDAAEAILKAAGDEESALIAVGSRGFGAIGRARLGSVSTKVLRAARGPVLVYPHSQD
jgi:nucleotide-binding universal stress UspA family protein